MSFHSASMAILLCVWKTYRYDVFRSILESPKKSKNNKDYVEKVDQYRNPHKPQEVEHLPLYGCYLKDKI